MPPFLPGIAVSPLPGLGPMPGRSSGLVIARPTVLLPGATQFIVPYTGRWTCRLTGGGGACYNDPNDGPYGGGSGAFASKLLYLVQGQTLPVSIGAGAPKAPNTSGNAPGGDTTVTLPTFVVRAGGGASGAKNAAAAGGAASGGDVNLSGGSGANPAGKVAATSGQGAYAGAPGDGGGSPGDVVLPGGNGGAAGTVAVGIGGGGAGGAVNVGAPGGNGVLLWTYEGP